jgi:hypothetical protein
MNRSDLSTNSAIKLPRPNPNEAAEKARREKPLTISSTAMSRPPKPNPATAPQVPLSISSGRTWLTA